MNNINQILKNRATKINEFKILFNKKISTWEAGELEREELILELCNLNRLALEEFGLDRENYWLKKSHNYILGLVNLRVEEIN